MIQPTLKDQSKPPANGPVYGSTSDDRIAFDYYETPPAVTEALLKIAGVHFQHKLVLEPCVGDGAIAAVLRKFGCVVTTNDIDLQRKADTYIDAQDAAIYRSHPSPQWIVSNPPFGLAGPIVAQAVTHATVGVAMLVRLSFMEPVEDRRQFLLEWPPQHRLVTERISFRKSEKGSNTDCVTTEWVIWTANRRPLAGVPPHGVLLWKS